MASNTERLRLMHDFIIVNKSFYSHHFENLFEVSELMK
jgi:hypothetical protein